MSSILQVNLYPCPTLDVHECGHLYMLSLTPTFRLRSQDLTYEYLTHFLMELPDFFVSRLKDRRRGYNYEVVISHICQKKNKYPHWQLQLICITYVNMFVVRNLYRQTWYYSLRGDWRSARKVRWQITQGACQCYAAAGGYHVWPLAWRLQVL